MVRPIPPTLTPGEEDWDVAMSGINDLIFNRPFPLYSALTIAGMESSYPAASNAGCVGVIDDATIGWHPVISDETSYVPIGKQFAYQADSTAATVSDLKDDFNALLSKMQASGAQASS